jgi:CheY-like chemotaxis protein
VFYFTIPLIKGKSVTHPKEVSFGNLEGLFDRKTLLVAEDDDSNFRLLEEQLSILAVHIIRATNGAEAVDLCKTHRIDLVLMDIKMPIMDGYEATRQIREYYPDIPIIAHTAYHEENDQQKAFRAGCTDFISKPVHQDFLLSVIKSRL